MASYDLKRFRSDNGLKQSDLADILGVKQAYISEIEKGKKPLSKEAETLLTNKFPSFGEYIGSEQENDIVDKLIQVVLLQQDSIAKRDEQVDRLITLLENQLKK